MTHYFKRPHPKAEEPDFLSRGKLTIDHDDDTVSRQGEKGYG